MTTKLITEDQLQEIVESIWGTMLGAMATPNSLGIARESTRLTAIVQIGGTFHGAVLFVATERFARWATALMLSVPEHSLAAADIDDAVGELCNILAGGVKSLVPGPSSISLPQVMRDSQCVAYDPHMKMAGQFHFTCEGQPLEVRVMEDAT
jgi:chemotaxis protein CheX